MKNLIVIIGTCVVLFIACVLVLMPLELGETQSEVSFIKMLPVDWNPYQRLYDEMLYPTVRISSANGVGSGVIIHHKGTKDTKNTYILTAAHVVGNNSSVTVTFYTPLTPLNRGDFNASVVITDTNKDLALLRVLSVSAVKTAKLAPRNYFPFLFTPIYTVGCSLGLAPRPSEGIITVITEDHWEVSSPILPGNSGGPVYDANTHKVIGIAVWVKTYYGQLITTMAGIVPIQTIYEFLDEFYHKDTKDTKHSSCPCGETYQLCRSGDVSSELRISEGARPANRMDDEIKRANQSSIKQQPVLRKENIMIILSGKFGYPQGSLPSRSADQWAEVMKLNANRINEKRIIAIPDATGFSEKIADPSSDRFAQRITVTPDPRTGMTADMYKQNQRSNLVRSFNKYVTKLDEAFKTVGGVVAKKFCDAVDVAKSLFADGASARTIRATGTRLEGVGAAVIVPLFLTNHPDAMSKVRPGSDIVASGGPVNVTLNGQQNVFVSMLTQVLNFSLIQADT
jgi:S1-C subfamily serine protease